MARKHKNYATFEQWHALEIEEKMNIRQVENLPILQEWLQVDGEIAPDWVTALESCRLELVNFYNAWNEQELLAKFIGPLLVSISLRGRGFNLFHERAIKAKVGDYEVSGVVDGMLARGSYEPEKPYFFLHEYKRMKQSESDPLGQLLIAMLASRVLNDDGLPLYGCYIIGTYWRFVVLEHDTYSQSQGYDATDKGELRQIWLTIEKTKKIVEERILLYPS